MGDLWSELAGKPDGYDLGDGTWCWNEVHDSNCPANDGEAETAVKRDDGKRWSVCPLLPIVHVPDVRLLGSGPLGLRSH